MVQISGGKIPYFSHLGLEDKSCDKGWLKFLDAKFPKFSDLRLEDKSYDKGLLKFQGAEIPKFSDLGLGIFPNIFDANSRIFSPSVRG